jgi:hypothetical protein
MTNPTLKGFLEGKFTQQEIYDFVYNKIIEQGKPSMVVTDRISGATSCAYRGENGCKCAIGHLLTDEDLKDIEKHNKTTYPTNHLRAMTIMDIMTTYLITPSLTLYVDKNTWFISRLQRAHDNYYRFPSFIQLFKEDMKSIAIDYNLKG